MASKLNADLKVRMSTELYESVKARAEKVGMSRVEFIRLILSLPIVVDVCGPRLRKQAHKSKSAHNKQFGFTDDFAFDSALNEAEFGSQNNLNPTDYHPDSDTDFSEYRPEAVPLVVTYTPSDGVATALAKLDYIVHTDVTPQSRPRNFGRPKSDESADRYAINTLEVCLLTEDQVRKLSVAIDRWGTNYNQATHALNFISKAIRDGIIEDEELTQLMEAELNDIEALLLESLNGLVDISDKLSKLGVKTMFSMRHAGNSGSRSSAE
ncbi:hypothetical protein H6A18_10565 [Collinsella tanakaei]|uniref:hypothetical protein n=1 Tax=Collinsella tanakaei TaxID=626935 RepID=UPI00195C5F55|nr:hypothetical protein [Collinsella tanakaei]MBM6756941.1 hypothetical protein [Collinsella tanakaei]